MHDVIAFLKKMILGAISLNMLLLLPASAEQSFDLKTGNAATDVILPAAAGAIFEEISPVGSDPSLVLRATILITGGWYEAAAPFHPTAVGVYSRLGRQPAADPNDNTDLNTAILYASRGVLTHLFPGHKTKWDAMLSTLGLDPSIVTQDPMTPAGIGNAAAAAMIAGRLNDGMNATGTAGGHEIRPIPFFDYTGYVPVNTAYSLVDPSRWQPDIQRVGAGNFRIQSFVTPQYRYVEPFTFDDAKEFSFPPPKASDINNGDLYVAQAQRVIDASAGLCCTNRVRGFIS